MSDALMKNIEMSAAVVMKELVAYAPKQVVSRTLAATPGVGITLFAFDQGEEISAHTAPGDALVQVLDGRVKINIDGHLVEAGAGDSVVMPKDVPHALEALTPFKMLLTVVKKPKTIGTML